MSRRRKNTFAKAISHIKSTKFDMVEDAPTNRTSGFMTITPNSPNPDYVPPHYPAPEDLPDFSIDGEDGKDTTGLFKSDGITPRTALPPITESSPDRSYILGPMSAMFYGWWGTDGTTTIGYIKQSDRRMMNLATIAGKLSDWDGASGFSSYGQLTLEQAVWFKNVEKAPGQTNHPDTANYRAFYPGPPSNSPDAFGRYYCTITGEGLDSPRSAEGEPMIPPGQGEMSPEDIYAAIMARLKKGEKLSKAEEEFLKNRNKEDEKEAESMLDKLKDHWKAVWDDLTNHDDIKKFGDDLKDMFGELRDAVPALEYSTDIAQSVLDNEPKDNSHTITQEDKDKLYDGINYDNIKINDTKEPYADDNIIEDENGNVRPRNQWPTDENGEELFYGNMTQEQKDQAQAWFEDRNEHPPNTKVVQSDESAKEMDATAGASNPLAAAGEAQMQVYKNENGDWVFSYHDHAYHNTESKDPNEVPGLGFINPKAWISTAVHAVSDALHDRPKESQTWTSNAENTGGMAGYPSNIRGDSIRSFETPLEKMPQEFQNWFNSQQKGNNKSNKNQTNSYRPRGRVISESKRSIIKNLKKPVVIPETKQKKYKVKPKIRGIENSAIISKPIETPKEYQPKGGRNLWGQYEYQRNVIQSQERKNEVLNLIGEGEGAFRHMLTRSKRLNAQEMEKFWGLHPDMHSHFYGGKKYKVTRKEQIHGDYLVFLVDEDGVKSNILQSKLNEKLAEEDDKRILDEYNKINPKPKRNDRISYEKDPLFKKVAKRLKKEIDYPDKPAKMGYPNDPPPKMVDGWHPEYGKRYKYDKLDPVSAVMMKRAPTGNPEVDANVTKAAKKPK